MKKLIIFLLILTLILTSTIAVFANTNKQNVGKICLDISASNKDVEYVKKHMNKKESPLSKEQNNIEITFTNIEEKDGLVILSGKVDFKMFGNMYHSDFESQALEIKYVKNKKFYSGCFEVKINENTSALLDITSKDSLSKAIVNVTLIDELDGTQQVMLYGDTFKEQMQLFDQELELAKKSELEQGITNANLDQQLSVASSTNAISASSNGSSFSQVGENAFSQYWGGKLTEKQLVVMTVGKCDPVEAGGGLQGIEMIRVFSRAYNVNKVEENVSFASPYSIHVEFKGDPVNLMAVSATKPHKETNGGMLQSAYSIFERVVNGAGFGNELAAINTIIKSVSLSVTDTINVSGVNATFDIKTYDLSRFDLNLPSDTGSKSSHLNTENGLPFKVLYTQDIGNKTAEITVLANITYRVFLLSDRTISKKSGNAKMTHTINLR